MSDACRFALHYQPLARKLRPGVRFKLKLTITSALIYQLSYPIHVGSRVWNHNIITVNYRVNIHTMVVCVRDNQGLKKQLLL